MRRNDFDQLAGCDYLRFLPESWEIWYSNPTGDVSQVESELLHLTTNLDARPRLAELLFKDILDHAQPRAK